MAFAVLSFASIAVVGLVSSIFVARAYGIEPIGELAIALAPSLALATLSQLREQAALVRELTLLAPRAPRVTGLFAAVMAFSFGLTLLVAIPVTAATWFVLSGPVGRDDLFVPALALIGIYTLVENTCWNLDVVFQAFRAGRPLFWVRLDYGVTYVAYALAINFTFGDDVWGLVAAAGLSIATSLVHRLVLVRHFMRFRVPRAEIRAGFRTLPALVRFGAKVAPGQIADGVSRQASVWVLSITSSVAAVGAYNRAWMLATRFLELGHRVVEMLFPTLVERRANGDSEGFDRASIDTVRYCVAGLLLPAAAGGGAADGLMDLFGDGFDRAADALALLLLAPGLAAVVSILTSILWTDDRLWLSTIITSVRAALTVGLTIVLAIEYGITGAAVAIVAAYLVESVWCFAVMPRHWSTPVRTLWPYRGMAALAAGYAAGFAAARSVDAALYGEVGTACAVAAGAVVYLAIAVGGGLQERDRERLAAIRGRRAQALPTEG
ncbi:MAG TPA: polysaccharide biosynthesis C-terminal domain-containing protein [Thermoleophilaceae bacterium]